MANQRYQYTVTTPHGDVNLSTSSHHSEFDSIEEFLRHHKQTISTAYNVTNLAISGLGLYLSHGRAGARLK